MIDNRQKLIEQAKAVLQGNWCDDATVPAPRLYPHQWSWDAAFIAIGYTHYDQPRAQQELVSLFRGQWANGLLPHIVFNPAVKDYFPGPALWQTERSAHAPRKPRTSGIVQPPVHATAAWHVYHHGADKAAAVEFLRGLFPMLRAWHEYLYRERDLHGDGLVYIRHPWESGQDNSPLWDRALARIQLTPDIVPTYRRVDTSIVDADERPTAAQYDRYAYLVRLFSDNLYDERRIRQASPFLIQDVLFNTLLVQAGDDLARIATLLGEDGSPYQAQAARTAAALNERLWHERHAMYFNYDLVEGAPIHSHVAAGFLPLFAGVPTPPQAELMLEKLNSRGFCPLDENCYAVPSYDKLEPGFDVNRYWRGPIWVNVNWLLYHGLRRYGFDEYADRVREAMVLLPGRAGFHEYFDPNSGRGYGSDRFSWSAALLIDLLAGEEGASST